MSELNPVCLYIHGFGGISYNHAFAQRLAKEFRDLNFSCATDTYPWRSPKVILKNTNKEWNDAKLIAKEE